MEDLTPLLIESIRQQVERKKLRAARLAAVLPFVKPVEVDLTPTDPEPYELI